MMSTGSYISFNRLYDGTINAVLASMPIVHQAQMNMADIERLGDKDDRSILTTTDKRSEAAAKIMLGKEHPNQPVLGEETGASVTNYDAYRHLFMHDPIDGTRPFLVGASTSTVISGLYDLRDKQVVAATIGEPSTGRIWHASDGTTFLFRSDETGKLLPIAPQRTRVWDGDIRDNGTITIDNFKGFARGNAQDGKRQILTNANIGKLFLDLHSDVAIQNFGSNGYHHALVANGGETMAGSITTSMGGEWDVPGALAVINAGGVAEGLQMTDKRTLQATDPLNPFAYDILITANNLDSLDFLRASLIKSL